MRKQGDKKRMIFTKRSKQTIAAKIYSYKLKKKYFKSIILMIKDISCSKINTRKNKQVKMTDFIAVEIGMRSMPVSLIVVVVYTHLAYSDWIYLTFS